MNMTDIARENVDALTGLYNRRFLSRRVEEYLKGARSDDLPLSIILIDLDHFKAVNDTYGHARGDSVLIQFASFLRGRIRCDDSVFRYGGDEFVCILPNTGYEQAIRISQRFLEESRAREFARNRITMSIGIASFPEDGPDWMSIFDVADQHLYSAKKHGRDRIGIRGRGERSLIIPTPEIAGRSLECLMIEDSMRRTYSGRGGVICISGETGVGKTRLFREMAVSCSSQKGRFVCSNLSAATHSIPYYPFREMIRTLISVKRGSSLDQLSRVYQIELAKIAPELLKEPAEEDRDVLMVDRFRLFEGVRRFLELQIGEGPLCICIDNVHWADENSLELFHYLLGTLRESPVLFMLAYRIEEAQDSAFQEMLRLAAYENALEKIDLEPLEASDTAHMISLIIDACPPANLSEYIYRKTGGNPFFVEELMKTLLSDGALSWNGSSWEFEEEGSVTIPFSIEGVVERKLGILGTEARSLLEYAAVIGREVDFAFLHEVSMVNEGHLFDLLDEIVEMRLFSVVGGEKYCFSEDIIREIIYDVMNESRLRHHHRRVGEKLLLLNIERIDKVVEELSSHFYQGGDWDRAVEYSIIAGDRAKAAYANRDAVGFYTRAIECIELSGEPGSESKRTECLRNRALVYNLIGENERAIADLEEAISHSERAGRIEDKAGSLIAISRVYDDVSRYDRAEEAAEEALRIYREEGDKGGEAQSLLKLAVANRLRRDYQPAIEFFRLALEVTREFPEHEVEMKALNGMGTSYAALGEYDKALDLYNEALILSEQRGEKTVQIAALVNIGNISYYNGDYPGAVELYHKAMVIIKDIGSRRTEAITSNNLGCIYIQKGDYSRAIEYLHNSLVLYRETDDRANEAGCYLNLGEMHVRQGNIKKGHESFRNSFRIFEGSPNRDGLAKCHTREGNAFLEENDIHNAKIHFDKAEEIAEELGSRPLLETVLVSIVALHLEEGDLGSARGRLDELMSLLDEYDSKEIRAKSLCFAGRISSHEGDRDTANSFFQRSIALCEELDDEFMLAIAIYYQGLMLMKAGDETSGKECIERALRIFTQLGAMSWVGRLGGE